MSLRINNIYDYLHRIVSNKIKIVKRNMHSIDNLVQLYQKGGFNEKYTKISDTMLQGRNLLELLKQSYNNIKTFNDKLGTLSRNIKLSRQQFETFNNNINLDAFNKYDDIINMINASSSNSMYNFDITRDDIYLFSKSENAKWQNLVAIYTHFIGNYKSFLERIKDKSKDDVIMSINSEIERNYQELQAFIKDLSELRAKLSEILDNFNSLSDPQYVISDIKINNSLKLLPDDFRTTFKFSTMIKFVEDDKFTILESIIGALIAEFSTVQQLHEYPLPNISRRYSVDSTQEVPIQSAQQVRPAEQVQTAQQIQPAQTVQLEQTGGSLYQDNINFLLRFGRALQQVNSLMGEVQRLYTSYINYQIRLYYFVIYLLLIMNSINEPVDMYVYINKSILIRYLNLLVSILNGIETNNDDKIILYFSTYHYITIKRLVKFINFIVNNTGENDMIDINMSTGSVRDSFVLFNHFKNILDKIDKI